MYNENHTKKAMKYLREHRMIDTMKELGGVLITVLNYDYYQDPKNYESTTKGTKERTNAEPMQNHPLPDNNKKEKKENKENNKHIYGEFKNVKLTDEELSKLQEKFGDPIEAHERIEKLSSYLASKGDKYKSHYATILNWERRNNPNGNKTNNFRNGSILYSYDDERNEG